MFFLRWSAAIDQAQYRHILLVQVHFSTKIIKSSDQDKKKMTTKVNLMGIYKSKTSTLKRHLLLQESPL